MWCLILLFLVVGVPMIKKIVFVFLVFCQTYNLYLAIFLNLRMDNYKLILSLGIMCSLMKRRKGCKILNPNWPAFEVKQCHLEVP